MMRAGIVSVMSVLPPKSGHDSARSPCPLGAKSGHSESVFPGAWKPILQGPTERLETAELAFKKLDKLDWSPWRLAETVSKSPSLLSLCRTHVCQMSIRTIHLAVSPNLQISDGVVFEKWVGFYQLLALGSACCVGTRHNKG